jgi:hypothetical protein
MPHVRGDSLTSAATKVPGKNMPEFTEGDNMSLIISVQRKQYELPDEGEHLAVLADVIDLGEVRTTFGMKEKVRLIFLVQQRDSEGKHIAVACSYNKTLYEKSNLCKAVKTILGRDPEDTFHLETLLGANVRLVLDHHAYDGRTFAGIVAILRPRKGDPTFVVPAEFVRAKDRQNGGNGGNDHPTTAPVRETDPPKTGPVPNGTAMKQPNRGKNRTTLAAPTKTPVTNLHGVDVTDKEVQFPGDED